MLYTFIYQSKLKSFRGKMSFLTLLMITSFPALILLWLSYLARGENKPRIPFAFWPVTQIYCFIAILGIGMMQSHLDCRSLWGDCYAHHYPVWLANYKPLLLNSISLWLVLAIIVSSNPMALQGLPQPIDHVCSSEHLPDIV